MRIVLVGASGYGTTYVELMKDTLHCYDDLCAIVDPFANSSPFYDEFITNHIPIFDTLEAFYEHHTADLVIISSPIQFHEQQAICAMNHGSHVLCEKPVTATMEQALRILDAQKATGMQCGVGFQWSFSRTMQKLKQNILRGDYGKPVFLKAFLSWPREDAYYNTSTWKGRIRDAKGNLVMDAIASNATAHYLHNMLFVLGDTMYTSRMPVSIESSLYRARPIETFDTCFVRGTFTDGSRFLFVASHVSEVTYKPAFSYTFEQATILMQENQEVIVHWNDGTQEFIGCPQTREETGQKILNMQHAIQQQAKPACGIETVLPHLAICGALFKHVPVHPFPDAIIRKTTDPASVEVVGLTEAARTCYEMNALPDELGFTWAAEKTFVPLDDTIF